MAVRAPKRERKQREERKQRQRALIDEDAEVFVVRARDGEVGGLAAALPVERRDVAQVQRPAAAAEQRSLRDERQDGRRRLRRERKRATRPTTASASAARKKTTGTTFRVLLPDVLLVGG